MSAYQWHVRTTPRVASALFALLLAGILLCGCSSVQGPIFKPVQEIPAGQCLVYVYRPDDGMSTIFDVSVNGEIVGTLERGTYVPLYLPPGKVTVTSIVRFKFGASGLLDAAIAGETSCIITTEPNRIFYVEGVVEEGNPQQLKLLPAFERYGQIRIRGCHLLPPVESSQQPVRPTHVQE